MDCQKKEFIDERKKDDSDDDLAYESKKGVKRNFCHKIRQEADFQYKFMLSVFVCLTLMMQGCSKGQMGPTMLDLVYITDASLEQGSGFLTSYSAGRLTGSIFAGIIYNKVNTFLLFAIATTSCCMMAAVIPWCFQYPLMVIAHVIYGTANGMLDVAITSESLMLWGSKSRYFVHISRFSYSVVTVIFPIITAPFLLEESGATTHPGLFGNFTSNLTSISMFSPTTVNASNMSYTNAATLLQVQNLTFAKNFSINPKKESRVYVSFLISSAVALVSSIPFYFLLCKKRLERKSKEPEKDQKSNWDFHCPVSNWIKRGLLINLGVYSAAETAIDSLFPNFLSALCVTYLNWRKDNAAYLTSAYFLAKLMGRLSMVLCLKVCRSNMKILGSCVLNCLVSFAGFTVCVTLKEDLWIWILTIYFGLSMSIGFAAFLCWTNEVVLPVTGHVSAYFMVSSFIGSMVSPMIMGILMEEITYLWFCYLIFILCVIMLINYIIMLIYTRLTLKLRKLDITYEVDNNSEVLCKLDSEKTETE